MLCGACGDDLTEKRRGRAPIREIYVGLTACAARGYIAIHEKRWFETLPPFV
jgi:hypothetical protein